MDRSSWKQQAIETKKIEIMKMLSDDGKAMEAASLLLAMLVTNKCDEPWNDASGDNAV